VCDERLGFAEALELARGWLVPTIRPTAIIAETEEVALAILDVARALKIAVPRELSLLSLEDRASLVRATPPVSTLFHPYGALFARACTRLIAHAQRTPTDSAPDGDTDEDGDENGEDCARFRLIERASIARAPRAV
jgi:DNA-binding LacI/PurR family transcriptional regulator